MIERLLDGERQLGGEAYHSAMAQILEAGGTLSNLLDDTGRRWLEKMGDTYGQRERVVMEAAFREGFCQAALLALDVLAYYESSDEYDERPYCANCYYALDKDQSIHDYYDKPEAVFHGKGPRFFGVELEIDGAGERAANALALLNIANRDGDCAYIKHDGSLNEGLEIVTIP